MVRAGEAKTVSVTIQIPPAHFVYKDKTQFQFINASGFKISAVKIPEGGERRDPFFGKTMTVFENEAILSATLDVPAEISAGRKTLEALLKFQGCSDKLCYPEETHLISFAFDVVGDGAVVTADQRPTAFSWRELLYTHDFSKVTQKGWWIVLLVVLAGGFLTSLTPCVLPLIPITLMIIGVRADQHWRRNFFLAASLVLGLSLMYAGLGLAAVALGKSLGFVFQSKGFLIFLSLVLFVLSLSMFGLYEIHLPQRIRQRLNHIQGHGFLGAFASGMAAGVLAAPCAGPVIGALLLFVATTQNYFRGFFLLLVYALGMGFLFLMLGTVYGELQGKFRGGRFTLWIKRFLGIMLLLGALFYFNSVVPIQKQFESLLQQKTGTIWIESEPRGLRIAQEENKPVIIDFYAEWCPPCKELELRFFSRPDVRALLDQMVPVRIDATFLDNPGVIEAVKKYQVIGWPTVVFVAPDGAWLKDLTVVSYNPDLLFQNLRRALEIQVK